MFNGLTTSYLTTGLPIIQDKHEYWFVWIYVYCDMCTLINRFEEEEGALADKLTELGAEKADNIQSMLQEVGPQLVLFHLWQSAMRLSLS